VPQLHLSTPLSARYAVDYDPESGQLHIDLAADAELGQSPEVGLLVTALRGSDRASESERQLRGDTLVMALRQSGAETPLASHSAPGEAAAGYQGLTLLHLGAVESPDVSLIGDFNSWQVGHDPLHFVLGGKVAYRGRKSTSLRIEYRLARGGTSYADPWNLEVVWAGLSLPPNPNNLLGGNLGEFNSVAYDPGYVEHGPRLRRLPLPSGPLGTGEVYVYLPPDYAQQPGRHYPSLYIHDGKDAIVRGSYDRSLYSLAVQRQIPEVVGVFIAAPSDATQRLAALTHYADPSYPEVTPQGDAYGRYLLDTVLPKVERTYRSGVPRAMLGVDMAGPFSFCLAWSDPQQRFTRIASQSGRFGWGSPPHVHGPYYNLLASKNQSAVMQRLAFDWGDSDQFQVQANDDLRDIFTDVSYSGRVRFSKEPSSYSGLWPNARARALTTLPFLLQDLVTPVAPSPVGRP
jgi:hypothetical protein